MTIASRTPEGLPSRCSLCGAETRLEYTQPPGDAPCPNCGYLLWQSSAMLEALQRRLPQHTVTFSDGFHANTLLNELGGDSLDTVELVMELEEEFGVNVPDDVSERLRTVGDVVRYVEEQRRKRRSESDD